MIKNVIFDFDDTLTRSHQLEYKRHMRVAKKLGLKILTEQQFLSLWGPPWSAYITILWPGVDVQKFERQYVAFHKTTTQQLLPGARTTLRYLIKKDYNTYLLTSRDYRSLMRSLKKRGIVDHFKQIHAADHSTVHKPNPGVFTEFLALHGLNAAQSMYVGDLLGDYTAASGAGLTFVAVLTGAHERKKFIAAGLKPKYIIPSIKDLPAWLKRNA